MNPLWYVEIALLIAGPAFLWWARPRFPSKWELLSQRLRMPLQRWQVEMLKFAEAANKTGKQIELFHSRASAHMSAGTHSGGRR